MQKPTGAIRVILSLKGLAAGLYVTVCTDSKLMRKYIIIGHKIEFRTKHELYSVGKHREESHRACE